VFWIWDENNVDNILMFVVVTRQSRTFQLLYTSLAYKVCGKLGGDTARTADPDWPKGYSMPYNIVCSV